MSYKVIPIPEDLVSEVRQTLVSPQYKSLAANVSPANGYGPCRSCLKVFEQGLDRRIYFTYNSFEGRSSLPDPGPVFIHENDCTAYCGSGFPPGLLDLPVLIEAFAGESRLISRQSVEPNNVDQQIATVFSNAEVEFINLRNSEAGCFIARVERS